MNPSTLTKPVMDVAAPKSPTFTSLPPTPPATPSPTTPNRAATLPVRPAPFTQFTPQPAAPATTSSPPLHPTRPSSKKPGAPAQAVRRTPVALITVTVFVMLVLSALAVTVYVTSRTA